MLGCWRKKEWSTQVQITWKILTSFPSSLTSRFLRCKILFTPLCQNGFCFQGSSLLQPLRLLQVKPESVDHSHWSVRQYDSISGPKWESITLPRQRGNCIFQGSTHFCLLDVLRLYFISVNQVRWKPHMAWPLHFAWWQLPFCFPTSWFLRESDPH